MTDAETYKLFEAKSPGAIIERFLSTASIVNSDLYRLPVIEFFTSEGFRFLGTPLRLEKTVQGEFLLIKFFENLNTSQQPSDVIYMHLSSLRAIRVLNATEYAYDLSFGKALLTLNEAPLTRLNAKRLCQEKWESKKIPFSLNINWESFPQSGTENNQIKMLVFNMAEVISAILMSPDGQSVLKNIQVMEIQFSVGCNLEFIVASGSINCKTNLSPETMNSVSLKTRLEAVL